MTTPVAPISLLRPVSCSPRLLVSVRSADEAQRALAYGAEIIDIKEPSRGSLAMADESQLCQIASLAPFATHAKPLSVALGELHEWDQRPMIPRLPRQVSFVKLGLRGAAGSGWVNNWIRVREQIDQQATSPLRWVAVAYADSGPSESPPLDEVLAAACETRCAGLLIDTWTKGQKSLPDWVRPTELTRLAETCHAQGLFLALAGQVTIDTLPRLANVPVDIIAVRSAVCASGQRTDNLDPRRVEEFLRAIRTTFRSNEASTA